ncbi:MAG: hypothetical protein AVO35_09065 [Candidatus Aegiribacteria sp. MLS_C]|nr:MAG: hypothetical protein AVO35_09065 [Candidatus Aegiribacteria sp. MLS_C]
MSDKNRVVPRTEEGTVDDRALGATPFTLVNYVLFALGLVDIVAGWFLLRGGHITAAPIMLILGYCVIIPMAIILRRKKPDDA